jgi:hypothetical protein
MATYDKTGVGGTTGHPSNGRTPYLVENTIDISAINSAAGTAGWRYCPMFRYSCRNFNHASRS